MRALHCILNNTVWQCTEVISLSGRARYGRAVVRQWPHHLNNTVSRTLSGGGKVHLCSSILLPYERTGWDKKTRERKRERVRSRSIINTAAAFAFKNINQQIHLLLIRYTKKNLHEVVSKSCSTSKWLQQFKVGEICQPHYITTRFSQEICSRRHSQRGTEGMIQTGTHYIQRADTERQLMDAKGQTFESDWKVC